MSRLTAAERTVACMRPDLIAGRVSSFMHTWRFARSVGAAYVLHWPKMAKLVPDQDYAIGNLFDVEELRRTRADEIAIFEEPTDDLALKQLDGFTDVRSLPNVTTTKPPKSALLLDPEAVFAAAPKLFIDRNIPIVAAMTGYAAAQAETAALFRTVPLNREVAAAVRHLATTHDLAGAVAVHLRRGDVVRRLPTLDFEASPVLARKWVGYFHRRYLPDECFLEELAEQGNPRVVVYSDSPESKDVFRSAYPGQVLDIDRTLQTVALDQPIQRDFLEFNLIGQSPVVLGTTESLFSQLSAELHGSRFLDVSRRLRAEHIARDLDRILGLAGGASDRIRAMTARQAAEQYGAMLDRMRLGAEAERLRALAARWPAPDPVA